MSSKIQRQDEQTMPVKLRCIPSETAEASEGDD